MARNFSKRIKVTSNTNVKKKNKQRNTPLLIDIMLNPLEYLVAFIFLILILIIILVVKLKGPFTNMNMENNNTNNNTNKIIIKMKTFFNNLFSNTKSKFSLPKKSKSSKNNPNEHTVRIVVEQPDSKNTETRPNLSHFQYKNLKAHERVINPLLPPERSMENSYGISINVPTRGEGGSFQQIGALYKEVIQDEDMQPGNNTDSVVLALFGKQTYPRSQHWTYYTSSNSNHQVKMPLSNKGRKCDSQYGCVEIMNDDLITVPGYNGVFRTVIYDYDAPKYIPCV
jgi:hypothetical protein